MCYQSLAFLLALIPARASFAYIILHATLTTNPPLVAVNRTLLLDATDDFVDGHLGGAY
jgi:hypothetical protein